MRLYKMELYKICSRKIFIFGVLGVMAIMLFYFMSYAAGAESTINGVKYKGYEAVLMDRKITEEFKGVLTDEKVERIVEKYGFPSEVREGINCFVDANYLNDFVFRYLSDGYFRSWDDYRKASKVYPIADTVIGQAENATGRSMILDYHYGWEIYIQVLEIGFLLGSVLVIFGISPVFSEEGHTGMLPLLFTAKEGKRKDITAKIAAGSTVTAAIYLTTAVIGFLLCGLVFGFEGLGCFAGIIYWSLSTWFKVSLLPTGGFILLYLLFAFTGGMLLCSITMLVSACFNNPFYAVVMDALLWAAPILIQILTHRVGLFMRITPVYLILSANVMEVFHLEMLPVMVAMAVFAAVACLAAGYRKYRRTL